MNSDEEAQRPLSGGAAAALASESPATLLRKQVAQTWLFGGIGAVISGFALAATGAGLTQGGESSGPFIWLIVCGVSWLILGLIIGLVIKELRGRQHRYRKMIHLQAYTLATLGVLCIIIAGGGLWFSASAEGGLTTLVQVGIWCQLVPWGLVFWAIHKYKIYSNVYKRLEQRQHPIELGNLSPPAPPISRRASTAQRSAHSPRPSRRPSTRNASHDDPPPTPRTWATFRSNRAQTEEHDQEHHSRGTQADSHASHHTDPSIDSADDMFPHSQHPPYIHRAPFAPSAPGSVHLAHRRLPSDGSLPDDDIFELPRRSAVPHVTHPSPSWIVPTPPNQSRRAGRRA